MIDYKAFLAEMEDIEVGAIAYDWGEGDLKLLGISEKFASGLDKQDSGPGLVYVDVTSNEVNCSDIKDSVLILDEPTDGLGHNEVRNLREVFDELDCNQILLVSHEPQFLEFSDMVCKVTKSEQVSTIAS